VTTTPPSPEPHPLAPHPIPPSGSSNPSKRKVAWASLVGGLVLLALGYGVYALCKPLTPVEVTERFLDAKTAAQAKKYAVPDFHPALDTFYATPDDTTAVDIEIAGDGPAPAGVGGHFVGLSFRMFLPEFGRRVRMEVVFHLLDRDGWKVADYLFLTFDGQVLDPPLSAAANYREMTNPAQADGRKPVATAAPAKQWYENKKDLAAGVRGLFLFLKAGGLKTIGLVVLAVGCGAIALVRWIRRVRVTLRPAGNKPQ
jgi:hypothetical protein